LEVVTDPTGKRLRATGLDRPITERHDCVAQIDAKSDVLPGNISTMPPNSIAGRVRFPGFRDEIYYSSRGASMQRASSVPQSMIKA